MSERTETVEADADTTEEGDDGGGVLDGFGTDTTEAETTEKASEGGSYFSVRALLVAFVAVGGGMAVASLVPLVPYTALLGIPVGAFVHGLLASERRYPETALAGGASAGVAVVSSLLPQLVAGLNGVRLFAVAAAVGLVLSVLGHYFGRDLREGLSRDLS